MKQSEETLVPIEQPEEAPRAEQPAAPKMTIYDYEQKYVKRQNVRGVKFTLGFFAAALGVFLFAVLALLALRVFELNVWAGCAVSVLLLAVYLAVFVVPLVKILRTGYFITDANAFNARKAQRHNRKLRHEIADKMIDLTASVEGVGWYDSRLVGDLAVALRTEDEDKLKSTLSALYKGSVKKSARRIILKSAMRSAAYSAISPAAHIDAALVVVVNLQLIKDLVFLYGFRPSDAGLMRIFAKVVRNSLIAYGVGGMNVGSGVVKTMGDAVKGIPLLGSAISALIDSSVQGLTNGALTTVIGYQTIAYLNKEYRLQDILDGVVTDTEAEIEDACRELETELKGKKKKFAEAV